MRTSAYKSYKISWYFFIILSSLAIMSGAHAEATNSDISLSNYQVSEDVVIGTVVGEFSIKQEGSDTSSTQTYVFTLVDGSGDTNNNAFSIDNPTNSDETATLKTAVNLDSETAYTIRVRAQNQSNPGDSVEKNFTIIAIDTDPTASFTASETSGSEPLQVDFEDKSEVTSHDEIVSWDWTFENGTPSASTAQHPQGIVFGQDGTHTVTLTVTEVDGVTSQATTTITVTDTGPTAAFAPEASTGMEPFTVSFDNLSTSYDGITSYAWDFGNGATSTEMTPDPHTYSTEGSYTVKLIVKETDGDTSEATTTITVTDAEPDVDFLVSPTSGVGPLKVTFQDNSTVFDDSKVSYGWSFGDGTPSSNQKDTTHTYAAVAEATTYNASLTIQDADGSTITKTVQIEVLPDVDDPDYDNDGWTEGMGDCVNKDDPDNPIYNKLGERVFAREINPGAEEICGDGIDNDCFDGDLPCDEIGICTNLADKPLDVIFNAATPNIMFVIDDSGSMDWEMMTTESEGLFWIGRSDRYYLFETSDNLWPTNTWPVLGGSRQSSSERRFWKARWYGYNAMYYNPSFNYDPWHGENNADKQAPKLHPTKTGTFDLSGIYYSVDLAIEAGGGGATPVHVDENSSAFSTNGTWYTNYSAPNAYLGRHRYTTHRNDFATWSYTIPADGEYEVSAYTTPYYAYGWDQNAYYQVSRPGSDAVMRLRQNGYQVLGTWYWNAGDEVTVTVKRDNQSTGDWTGADAIRFVPGGGSAAATATITQAHYWTWNDTDENGDWDSGEDRYLVNFADSDGNGDLDTREFYRYVESDNDHRVENGELVVVAAADMPSALVTHTFEEDLQNYANWFQYYRKRWLTAVAAFTRVLPELHGVMVGYRTINGNSFSPVRPIHLGGSTDKSEDLIDQIKNFHLVRNPASTPLRDGLNKVGLYFHTTETTGSLENDLKISPLSTDAGGACQQNFAIIISDGAWNGGAAGFGNVDGKYDPPYYDDFPNTLADIAMYYYENDLAPAIPDEVPTNFYDKATWQHMVTYGVTFGVNGYYDPHDFDLYNIDPEARTSPTWKDPLGTDTSAKIDDIFHAAVNGRGKYSSAKTPQELIAFLKEAIDDVVARIGSGAGVTINGEEIDAGSTVYQSIYNTEGWTGDVKAYALDPETGEVIRSSYLWSAEEKLFAKTPSARKIATFNGNKGIPFLYDAESTATPPAPFDMLSTDATEAQNMVAYLRGDSSLEVKNGGIYRNRNFKINELTTRDTKLGDIVHSAPVFHSYVKGDTTHKIIYVGANDGMLHAFNAGNVDNFELGEEIFAYVPRLVFSRLKNLTEPSYDHEFFVDLTPYVTFVNATVDGGGTEQRAYLVGGLGKGGRGYYSLDVTDPMAIVSETDLAGKVLWEYPKNDLKVTGATNASPIVITTGTAHGLTTGDFVEIVGVEGNTAANGLHKITKKTDTTFSLQDAESGTDTAGNGVYISGGTLCPDPDLGYSYSRAFTVNSAIGWVTIFGNGYNSANLNAVLYVLDAHTGELLKKIDTSFGGPGENTCNGLSTPVLVDVNNDERVDHAYAGDLRGNLWKFDLTAKSVSDWTVAYANSDNTPMPLFTAKNGDNVQPITSMPDVMRPLDPNQPGYIVVFGTGRYVGPRDFSNTQVQTIYGIWDYGDDDDPSEYLGATVRTSDSQGNVTVALSNLSTYSSLQKQTREMEQTLPGQVLRVLTDNPTNYLWEADDTGGQEGNPSTNETNHVGWYFDLPDPKERVVQDVLIRSGRAIVISSIPNTNPCAAGGSSWLYELDANSGGRLDTPQFDINNDNVIDENDLIKIEIPNWTGDSDSPDRFLYYAPTAIWYPTMVFTPTIMAMGKEEIKLMSTAAGSIIDLTETGEKRGIVYWRQID